MKSRGARVRALAKINLDLRVLGKRPDGYHELRTVFQTISVADTLEIAYQPRRRRVVEIDDPLGIPGNLAVQAAERVLEMMGTGGRVSLRLRKRIPMGAGLGGGSSDAAAVLLALPVLAGREIPLTQLWEAGVALGSDVPFFLLGGAAVGIGRGAELFPLPDNSLTQAGSRGLLVAPDVHVSTAEAYRRLSPRLTTKSQENKIVSFQSLVWDRGVGGNVCNDFEEIVFEEHGRLARLKQRLVDAGACPALMTGSGSAIFGLFSGAAAIRDALVILRDERSFRFSLVSRARYRSMWWRALEQHIDQRTWPPRSRYAR
jgi:4-diphosphocytidyl-2-C-methyl-D-erythritol kinase